MYYSEFLILIMSKIARLEHNLQHNGIATKILFEVHLLIIITNVFHDIG